MRYLLVILLFPFSLFSQTFAGSAVFPDGSAADSVKVVLEGEEVPASYSATYTSYSPLGTTGTSVTLSDDSNVGPFNIGFNFKFFGTTYTQFRICTNGFITFGDPSGRYSPGSFPDASSPNGVVAPYWTDLYPTSGYYCRYRTEGTAPNRKLVITWHVTYYSAKSTWTDLQAVLFEGTNKIHLTIISQGKTQTATQGVENLTGTAAFTPSGRNLASFNGAGTTYELAPVTAIPGWQKIDSAYTDQNGMYSLSGWGSNYNYQLRVVPPLYNFTSVNRTNIVRSILQPTSVKGAHLTSHDINNSGNISISDLFTSYTVTQTPSWPYTPTEFNLMNTSTTTYTPQVSRVFSSTELDYIILYKGVELNTTTIKTITQ